MTGGEGAGTNSHKRQNQFGRANYGIREQRFNKNITCYHCIIGVPQGTLPDFVRRMELLEDKDKVKVGHEIVLNVVFVVIRLSTSNNIVLK